MSSKKSSYEEAPFTENGQEIYDLAFRIGQVHNSFFIGTEHLLLAILTKKDKAYGKKINRTYCWLLSTFEGIDLKQITEEAKNFILSTSVTETEKVSSRQNISPSLSRALRVAQTVCTPCGSEHLLAGIVLAKEMDGISNAACSIISKFAGNSITDRTMQTKLINALEIPIDRLSINFPKRVKSEKFHFKWCYELLSDQDTNADNINEKPITINNGNFSGPLSCTHYISNNICCGSTPGRMSKSELYNLVSKSKINAFVCLQESFQEYGGNDYRQTLKEMSFPRTFKFLHAPISDFSIMDDSSLLGLIAEIDKYISEDPENNVVYIHCYGGHGRTGTVLTNLIMSMEGCNVIEALEKLRQKHKFRTSCRQCSLSYGELEAREQTDQSRRMAPAMKRQHKIKK